MTSISDVVAAEVGDRALFGRSCLLGMLLRIVPNEKLPEFRQLLLPVDIDVLFVHVRWNTIGVIEQKGK